MDKGSAILIADRPVQRPRPVLPQLRLLIEWEPRHRVFLDNLTDLLLDRSVPQFRTTSRPAPFWHDVFVPADAPWSTFVESLLLQLLVVVLFVWGQSRVWDSIKLLPQREVVRKSIVYYPPRYRALESRAPAVRTRARARQTAPRQMTHQAAQRPISVTPQRKQSLVTPPDIKQATARMPNLPDSRTVTPMVPFTATAEARRNALAGTSSAVAPAPDLAGTTAKRALKVGDGDGARVVPPPPSVQSAGNPAKNARLNSLAGPQVVPPSPVVQEGNGPGTGRLNSLASGSQAVPPPPAVLGANSTGRDGRLSSFQGTGAKVVPPPPLVQGANAGGGRRLGTGAGPQVVPPPPSVQGSDSVARGARMGSLSGGGAEAIPPPPVEEARNLGAGGRNRSVLGGSSGNGSQDVASPPAIQSAGNAGGSGSGKILEPMDPLPTPGSDDLSANSAASAANQLTIEELPMGLLGLVFAAPGSSVYSNFEVFVAKRRVGKEKDQFQLIKLVYEFLPYQKRLSEYDLNNQPQRVIKLKVTPDPNCNEALGQILQPQSDPNVPITEYPSVPAALRSYDLNAVLPCYHISADEFQKAMSRAR
jgi:hypothetical protein